jgi:hypothetical protein
MSNGPNESLLCARKFLQIHFSVEVKLEVKRKALDKLQSGMILFRRVIRNGVFLIMRLGVLFINRSDIQRLGRSGGLFDYGCWNDHDWVRRWW